MKLTRRQFLARAAAGGAGLALLSASRAADSPRQIALCFSLYGMKSLPLAQALEACARIGYRGVELCLNPGFPGEPKSFPAEARRDVRRRLDGLGLELASVMNDLRPFGPGESLDAELESIRRAAAVVQDVAPGSRAPIESILGGKPEDWEATKKKAADRVRAWGETAAACGAVVAVKAHAGSAVNSPQRLLWLVQRAGHPHIAVNYDASHYEVEGYSLEESLRALAPWVRLVTMKDWSGSARAGGRFQFLLPGQGRADFVRYFRLLRSIGYTGAAVAEASAMVFGQPGYDPIAGARSTYAVLSAAERRGYDESAP